MRATFEEAELRPAPSGSVVSIGVFDGVHLGHQEILRRNVEQAREHGLEPTVLTFRRHPKRVLLGRA
ncbi:MAG: riboflavin biosynthesis protein RibF, partial [Planctomycetota bacterium]